MVQKHGATLGRKAGVENFAAHGGDLTHQILPAAAHTGHRDGFPHDAGLHRAAVALTGFCHGAAALATQQCFGGGTAGGVEVVGGDAAGGKAGAKTGFAHQQHAMGQPAGGQHLLHAGFQFCVAFHAVQHHDGDTPFVRRKTI